MHFGFVLELSDVDLWNIDLLDTHLDLLDLLIPSKYFVCINSVFKTSSRPVFKTSSRHVLKTSSRRFQRNNFLSCKMSSRRLGRRKIVTLKTCWRRLQDMSWRRLQDLQMFAGLISICSNVDVSGCFDFFIFFISYCIQNVFVLKTRTGSIKNLNCRKREPKFW